VLIRIIGNGNMKLEQSSQVGEILDGYLLRF
jgi:hypothetical protein